jgi:hypothetical protein
MEIKNLIVRNDSDIYNYFLKVAETQNRKQEFVNLYQSFSDYDKVYEEKYKLYIDLVNSTSFISARTPFEQIRHNFVTLKSLEDQLKQEIRFYLQNPSLISEFSDKDVKDLKDYIEKEHIYFRNEEYFEANLQLLMNAINTLPYLLHRKYFLLKKDVLSLMKDLEENRETEMIS